MNVPTYLKVDMQDYDLEVLSGGAATLEHVRALEAEASVLPIYAHLPSYMEALRTLDDRGFDLSGLFPVSHDSRSRL